MAHFKNEFLELHYMSPFPPRHPFHFSPSLSLPFLLFPFLLSSEVELHGWSTTQKHVAVLCRLPIHNSNKTKNLSVRLRPNSQVGALAQKEAAKTGENGDEMNGRRKAKKSGANNREKRRLRNR